MFDISILSVFIFREVSESGKKELTQAKLIDMPVSASVL